MTEQLILETDTYKELVNYHLMKVENLSADPSANFEAIKVEIDNSIYWADRLAELDKKNKKILLNNFKKECRTILNRCIKNLLSQQ